MLRFCYVPARELDGRSALSPALGHSSFSSVQAALPSIGITKRRLKQLEAISLIREQREKRKQVLAFNAQSFVLCGLPLRQPPQDQLTYTRRNGKFFREITAHPRFGLRDKPVPVTALDAKGKGTRKRRRLYNCFALSPALLVACSANYLWLVIPAGLQVH